MKKLVSTTALTAVLAVGVIGGAAAVPLSVTNSSVTVYNFTNPTPGNGGAASEQALPNAQLGTNNLTTSTFTYSGALNFALPQNAPVNTIAAFVLSSGGTVSNVTGPAANNTLSTSNFDVTTLFKFTFSTASAISGIITHDDGVSLFVSGNTANNLLPASAAAPTSASDTYYSIAAGTYDLYYTEANGLPAQLSVNVPEPSTLAVVGAGLVGLGLVGRRRRHGGASLSA